MIKINITERQIRQFLEDEGIEIRRTRHAKGEIDVYSPFVHDKTGKLSINYKKNGQWNDYKLVGAGDSHHGGHDFISFVQRIKELESYTEAKKWFIFNYVGKDDFFNISNYEETEAEPESITEHILPEGAKIISEKDHEYIQYLKERGVTYDQAREMRLFVGEMIFNQETGKKEKRVLIPVYEMVEGREQLIFYNARDITGKHVLRWRNPGGRKNHAVWGLNYIEPGGTVYVFEGLFDAMRMFPRGVCLFGANADEEQIKKIIDRSPGKIVVVMDNDQAGNTARIKLASIFSRYHDHVYKYDWRGIEKKDFGDLENPDSNRYYRYNHKSFLLEQLENRMP